MLYNKWWRKDSTNKSKACQKANTDPSKASALNVVNIGGVFVVLLCGLAFAILVAVGEFCWKSWEGQELHPATSKLALDKALPVNSSIWVQIYTTISIMFYGQREEDGVGGRGAECYSCRQLRCEGERIKYI